MKSFSYDGFLRPIFSMMLGMQDAMFYNGDVSADVLYYFEKEDLFPVSNTKKESAKDWYFFPFCNESHLPILSQPIIWKLTKLLGLCWSLKALPMKFVFLEPWILLTRTFDNKTYRMVQKAVDLVKLESMMYHSGFESQDGFVAATIFADHGWCRDFLKVSQRLHISSCTGSFSFQFLASLESRSISETGWKSVRMTVRCNVFTCKEKVFNRTLTFLLAIQREYFITM